MNDRIAVLIPCFNEELTIKKVINDIKKELSNAKIYVYDNNSTDNTENIAKKAGAKVIHEYRQGKGNVIRSMFQDINADCYFIVDGDNTYSVKQARLMCDYILNKEADMVIGDRLSSNYYKENKRLFHGIGNWLVRTLIDVLFRGHISDALSGCRAFSYEFVKTFPVLNKGFEIETEMTIYALDKNMIIKEVKTEYQERPSGSISKLHTFKDGYKIIKTIMSLFIQYKPLIFFRILSLIFFAISIAIGIPEFINIFKTNNMPNILLFVITLMSFSISIICITSGIILNVIAKYNHQLFEYNLINIKRK